MALPQKVVEQLGRAPARTPGWAGRIMMFAATVFFLAVAAYVGLAFGYRPYLEGRVRTVGDRIQALNQEVSSEDKAELLVYYSQLTNLKKLLDDHMFTSNIFSWLEANTQRNVTWGNFGFTGQSRSVQLSARARTIEDFIEQVQRIQRDPAVRSVKFGDVSFGTGDTWTFDLTIDFDRAYLTEPQNALASEGRVPVPGDAGGGENAPPKPPDENPLF